MGGGVCVGNKMYVEITANAKNRQKPRYDAYHRMCRAFKPLSYLLLLLSIISGGGGGWNMGKILLHLDFDKGKAYPDSTLAGIKIK